MLTDSITLSEIRSLVHQIDITEQNGDVQGAAALAWELSAALRDAGL